MSENIAMNLINMRNCQTGVVTIIKGGIGMISRLESLGIRPGVSITKKSALMGCGPIIIAVSNSEVAIGYGMASKVFVEVEG